MLYVFTCRHCGRQFERFEPRGVVPVRRKCRGCGRLASRDIVAEGGKSRRPFRPFYSEARGVCDDSERIPGERYSETNDLYVRSRTHMMDFDKRAGLIPRS